MAIEPASWVRDTRQYLTEVQSEYRKITWPAQKEIVGGTIGVVVIVIIITLALSLVDAVLGRVIRFALG